MVLFDHVGRRRGRPGGVRRGAARLARRGTPTTSSRSAASSASPTACSSATRSRSMIGVLADAAAPDLFDRLVLIGPSPRYIDDEGYVGGFSEADVARAAGVAGEQLPRLVERDGAGDHGQPRAAGARRRAHRRASAAPTPTVARRFAEVTFLSDNRADLPGVRTPTLVLQCSHDAIAPVEVGRYVADAIPQASLVVLDATGHCPHMSAPGGDGRRDHRLRPRRRRRRRMTWETATEAFYAALLDDDPEQLYERAPCGYLTTTPDGTIVKVNATFSTLTGYAPRGARRPPHVRRAAHRGRPDLPRDALLAAAADARAGRRGRLRDRPRGRRAAPGAGQRRARDRDATGAPR